MIWIVATVLFILTMISCVKNQKLAAKKPVTFGELQTVFSPLQKKMSGTKCFQCGENYVGFAQDCRCTNWGR